MNLFTSHLTAQDTIETVIGTDWAEREAFGTRFLSERDFPITEDTDNPTDDDWAAYAEMTFVDPTERNI